MHAFQHTYTIRLVALGVIALAAMTSCTPADTYTTQIEIHGAAKTGYYNKLIGLLNKRAKKLREACGPDGCQELPVECRDSPDDCHRLSEFEFKPAEYRPVNPPDDKCPAAGSITSLVRLGMETLSTPAVNTGESCKWVTDNAEASERGPDFALVQNYFVYKARSKEDKLRNADIRCEDVSSKDCESPIAKGLLRGYKYFEDLRIVLPLYYGYIQLITTEREDIGSLEDLKKMSVYLGGDTSVNRLHGREVIKRHPIFLEEPPELLGRVEAIRLLREKFEKRELGKFVESDGPRIRPILEDPRAFSADEVVRDELKAESINKHPDLETELTTLFASITSYVEAGLGQKVVGNSLLACGLADAYVISGELIREGANSSELCGTTDVSVKHISIPEVIIDGMTRDHSYYQKLDAPWSLQDGEFSSKSPAVTTYLVTRESTDVDRVHAVTHALFSDWPNLMLLDDTLAPISENILKKPAPFHKGARLALQHEGSLGWQLFPWYVFAIGCVLLFIMILRIPQAKYDRLGEKDYRLWPSTKQSIIDGSRVFGIVAVTIVIFVAVLSLVRELETAVAQSQNIDDQLSRFAFMDALLWMFTFISSGYENNVFPERGLSRFFVSFFAIVGIALPLWGIVAVVERARDRRLERARGGVYRGLGRRVFDLIKDNVSFSYRSKGMLLLCGWNSKAPGLIYTLTCPDSHYPGMINIIADMDVEYPINHWRFNRKRVRFYRGDASQRSTLERAEADKSDNVLILSDDKSSAGANRAGILTALAIRELNEHVFISAEMALKEGERLFSSSHVNDIVNPRSLARHMLAAACFSKHVSDFILDALSPDEYWEWYSMETRQLNSEYLNLRGNCTVADYSRALQAYGIHVVGICTKDPTGEDEDFSPNFAENTYLNPLLSEHSMQQLLPPESYVVCAARSPKSFQFGRRHNSRDDSPIDVAFSSESVSILPPLPEKSNILIIGYERSAGALARYLEKSVPGVQIDIIATDTGEIGTYGEVISNKIGERDWTHFIVLSSMPETSDAADFARNALRADTKTLLRVNVISSTLKKKKARAHIIAEVNNVDSRQLAKNARATAVIPTSLLVERMLAGLVCGKGHVSEMLAAMMSFDDGVYLRSVKLESGHPLVGRRFKDVLNTWFSDGRVLAVRPDKTSDRYINSSGDFDTHFVMYPEGSTRDLILEAKDLLIVLGYPAR